MYFRNVFDKGSFYDVLKVLRSFTPAFYSGDFYDKDGSGFLEYSELERFLRYSVHPNKI